MRIGIEFNKLGITRLDNIDVCYSSWVDPRDLISNLIEANDKVIQLDIESHAFLRFNKNNDLLFGIKNGELYHIDHTTKRLGACTTLHHSAKHHYITRMISRILDVELKSVELLFSRIKNMHGNLVTTIGNKPFKVSITDDFNIDSEMTHMVDYIKGRFDCHYIVAENTLYVSNELLTSVLDQDRLYEVSYPNYYQYIDYGLKK